MHNKSWPIWRPERLRLRPWQSSPNQAEVDSPQGLDRMFLAFVEQLVPSHVIEGFARRIGTELEQVGADAVARLADAADYTHVRWVLDAPLDVGATGIARFRAVPR